MRRPPLVLAICLVLGTGLLGTGLPLAAAQLTTSGSALVVIVPGEKRFHQPGCPLVRKAGSKVQVMKRGEAERRGLESHDCGDPGVEKRDAAAAANTSTVYVQPKDKRYHQSGCTRLKGGATAITVEKAAQDHWPCPACKPPIRQRTK